MIYRGKLEGIRSDQIYSPHKGRERERERAGRDVLSRPNSESTTFGEIEL